MAACVGWSCNASAYRPFEGTDADVAYAGDFELEAGPAYPAARHITPSLALPARVLNRGLVHGVGGENVAELPAGLTWTLRVWTAAQPIARRMMEARR
jgi:hypothetical protein